MRNMLWLSFHGLITLVLVGTASYFLLIKHGEHVYPALPYLILLMCPLMHLFMHKSHATNKHQNENSTHSDAYLRGYDDGKRSLKEAGKTLGGDRTPL